MSLYYPFQRLRSQRGSRCKVRPFFIYLLILVISIPLLIKLSKGSFFRSGRDSTLLKQKEIHSTGESCGDLETSNTEFLRDIIEGPIPDPSYSQVYLDGKIGQGGSIYQCLHREGVSDRNIQLITANLNPLLNFRSQTRSGDEYRLTLSYDGEVERFEYLKSSLEIYCLSRDQDNTWNVWRENIRVSKYWVRIYGQIKGSLFTTFQELGYPVSLALQFAEILEWKIDFQHEVREGDSYGMVFERFFKGDEPIGYGRVLAVIYDGQVTGKLEGFYIAQEGGRGDYYSPDGVSLRRAFLRAPLSYKYISSGFSYHRKHPILGCVRPHLGIDYAAPYGSPIWAVADGIVLSKTYDKNNGNQVKLKHMNGYITYYNHLSRFAKGLKKGKRVVQKQVIGYVGTTGLSTGPHLDYRVKKNGRFLNPLRAKYPSGKPLKKAFLPQFRKIIAGLSPILVDDKAFSQVLVAEVDSSEISHSVL